MDQDSIGRLVRDDVRMVDLCHKLQQRHPELVGRLLEPKDLGALVADLPLCDSLWLEERLHALLPYPTGKEIYTLVIGSKRCHLLSQTPRETINQFLLQLYNIHGHAIATKVITRIFGNEGLKRIPFPHRDYTLVSMGQTPDMDGIWINPAVIEEFIEGEERSYIRCAFGLTLASPLRTLDSLVDRMQIAFRTQGIYRRDHTEIPCHAHQSLQEYLGLRDSQVVRRAVKGMTVDDIPGDDGILRDYGRTFMVQEHEKNGQDATDHREYL